MKKNIIIYRDSLLPYSQTFIPAQGESLLSYQAIYTGVVPVAGVEQLLPLERTLLLSDVQPFSKFWRLSFKLFGFIHPSWLQSIKIYSPCLIHAHFGLGGVWTLPLSHQLHIPLIVTFHGFDLSINQLQTSVSLSRKYEYQLYLKKLPILFKKVNLCLAVSKYIYSRLLEKGCSENKVMVHYIGTNLDYFTPDYTIIREPVILFVGRLVEKKGCKFLIQAMEKVQTEIPNIKLVIIGDGPLRNELETLANQKLKNYKFLGKQPLEIVKYWMNTAMILCVPSVTAETGDMEGLPTVIMEGQAMGLPVVSTFHSGIPEIIIHEKTGLLTKERDWENLAHYLLLLLKDQNMRSYYAEMGRNYVQENFDIKQNTAKLEEIYTNVLETSNKD
ncbi:MAG: glycosyltransferase [Crocosphaera sp.]|nr:glycosyltransferase [Crocosphaera sp.]